MKELKINVKARYITTMLCSKCKEDIAISKLKYRYLYKKEVLYLCENCLMKFKIEEVIR